MKVIVAVLFVLAFAKAERDWSKVFPKHIKDVPHARIPHGIPNPRITGGEEAWPHSIPYQVGLFIPVNGGTAFCGGSLVGKQTVLTAAHCVEDVTGPVEVILGAHRIRDNEPSQVRVNSSGILVHPHWSSLTLRNDLALVRLPEPIETNDVIQVIELASDDSNSFEGHQAHVSGWGLDSDESSTISPVLREVSIPIISNTICGIAYLGVIQETHICASGLGGKSTCSGDSGGPLVIGGQQVGIVSFGIALGCEIGWPPAFTRVTSFHDWVEANLI